MTGEFFADFVRRHLPNAFRLSVNPRAKRMIQDGDPSQNSAEARTALQEIGAVIMKIPARSPDLNPIENLFSQVKVKAIYYLYKGEGDKRHKNALRGILRRLCNAPIVKPLQVELRRQAFRRKIRRQSFTEFARRVKRTMLRYPVQKIDTLISSMDRRVRAVIARRGQRINY